MRIQNLEALVKAAPLKVDTVELPGGDSVRVRELSVAQRMEFATAVKAGGNVSPLLVEMAVLDDDNAPAFAGQRDAIAETIDPVMVELIARRVLILSGLIREEKDAGEA